jgi:hypothetical protein
MSPSKLIDGHTPEHLLKCAEDIIKKKTKASVVMDREAEARVPKFKDAGKYRTLAQQCSYVARFCSFLFLPAFYCTLALYAVLNP